MAVKSSGAIVPAVSKEGWMPLVLGLPYEARCGHCPARHSPDSEAACWRWLERHLLREHGVTIETRVQVRHGAESVW